MSKKLETLEREVYETPFVCIADMSVECLICVSAGAVDDYTEEDLSNYFGA